MNESWADFEDFGNVTLSESTMDYIKSLDNAVVGHAYASVFGAGTSASEFEFLTGDSMAFLPSGSIPYQQYTLGPSDSLATLLKGYGYETRAFHPGEKTSWQRNTAYPRLGFDSFKCGEEMDVPQTEEHGYVSDDSDFKQVIWEFEHKQEGTPLFLFNVTIQNHGAYTVEDYPAEVTVEDAPGEFPKAEQYLTLANKTDESFRQLVEYFEQQTEPTIIVMFGDHQPSVEQEFLDMAYGVSEDGMTMTLSREKPEASAASIPVIDESATIDDLKGVWALAHVTMDGVTLPAEAAEMAGDTLVVYGDSCDLTLQGMTMDGLSCSMDDFALLISILDGEAAATLREDGTLCLEMSDVTLWYERTGDAPEITAEPVPEATSEPAAMPEPAASGAEAMIGKKYVMTDADVNGYNMTAAQMGNLEYSILLQEDGTVTFVMAGSDIPGLTWAYGKIPTEAGEADGIVIDYYTQALNLAPTEKGFDMDYFGSMLMHFAPEDSAQ